MLQNNQFFNYKSHSQKNMYTISTLKKSDRARKCLKREVYKVSQLCVYVIIVCKLKKKRLSVTWFTILLVCKFSWRSGKKKIMTYA